MLVNLFISQKNKRKVHIKCLIIPLCGKQCTGKPFSHWILIFLVCDSPLYRQFGYFGELSASLQKIILKRLWLSFSPVYGSFPLGSQMALTWSTLLLMNVFFFLHPFLNLICLCFITELQSLTLILSITCCFLNLLYFKLSSASSSAAAERRTISKKTNWICIVASFVKKLEENTHK